MEESLIGKLPFYPEARMEAGVGTGVLVGRSLKAGVLSRVWRNYTPGYFSPTVCPLLLYFVIDIGE